MSLRRFSYADDHASQVHVRIDGFPGIIGFSHISLAKYVLRK